MNIEAYALLAAVAAFLIGYAVGRPRTRSRLWRRIRCLLGDHAPGPVRAAPGGRNIQRCDYCDRVVSEYQVTPGQALHERDRIRRVK